MSRRTKTFVLGGGENHGARPVELKPGELLFSENYEGALDGGYRLCDGIERYDGRPSPSAATYYTLAFDAGTGLIEADDTVTGGTTGHTATVLEVVLESGAWGVDAAGTLILYAPTGVFQDNEDLEVSSVVQALAAGTAALNGEDDPELHATYHGLAEEVRRALITVVPGEGPVRGVWIYNGDVYAFRDNVGQTECKMYKATTSGWAVQTTATLNPGGRYRFANANFLGSAASYKMYGVDGVNKGFQWDGSTFTQVSTAMTSDTPRFVAAHKRHLFYGFANGSLQHSPPGDPTGTWSLVLGANEIGTGDEITGLQELVADVLGVWNRNSTYLLYGSSNSDWDFKTFDDKTGAIENTLQNIGGAKFLDDRGLFSFDASQAFGDFEAGSISHKVNAIMDLFRGDIVDSMIVRTKNQYRMFRSDGYGLTATFKPQDIEFTRFNLGRTVSCACSGEAADGTEMLFIGSEDGYVYQVDSGWNLDGDPMIGYLRLAFGHFGDPRRKKRVFRVSVDFTADQYSALAFTPDFDYSAAEHATARTDDVAMDFQDANITPGGGYWGFDSWSDFYWSQSVVGQMEGYVNGTGTNFGLLIRNETTYKPPHTLHSVSLDYSVRGLKQ